MSDKKEEQEQPQRGFKVDDRRRFTEDATAGEHAEERASESAAQEDERAAQRQPEAGGKSGPGAREDASVGLAEMTFTTFVMGISTQALMQLGEIEDPVQRRIERDLPAAKQMIDLLGILRDKTKGNLDADEDELLANMLYDLRMRYVEVSRSK